ncbi:MAG: DUF2868 domain-containing protein [Acidobacteria bacterium]|nr:DUF2868 domain-containing protein [Acidobacteriota bacterium]
MRGRAPVPAHLRDAATDTVTRPAARDLPDARNWRDRAARAAAADVGRAEDPRTVRQARRLSDRGRVGAGVALGVLAGLGAVAGWTTAAELLRPAAAPVHPAAALLVLVGGPWLVLTFRSIVLLLLRRRAAPLLGRLVTTGLLRAAARSAERDAGSRDLAAATARRIASLLAAGSGRRLAAAGSGTFWTSYALVAVATIWIVTARVALGFGWESSWIPPSFGRAVVELAAAPPGGFVGSAELTPIGAPPVAPADDPAALAARRAWIRFLTAGVAIYLLVPMAGWTLLQAALGHRRAERWRPAVPRRARAAASVAARRRKPAVTPPGPPPEGGGACTHVARLERPAEAADLPAPLDRLVDLGDVDAAADLERARETLRTDPARVAVVGWLPATPDRGVRRRLRTLAGATTEPPLLVLDGGGALRRSEPPRTAAVRLEDWRALARETGVVPFECDLAALTAASRQGLARAAGHGEPREGRRPGRPGARPESGPTAGAGTARAELDPAPLDAAFDVIGRHLEGDDPLPSDAGLASCLGEVARTFQAEGDGGSSTDAWRARLAGLAALDRPDVSSHAASLARTGIGLLPAALRTRAVWAGLGGLLGVAACAAAATVAPGALLALPGWAATGAGVAGLLSLARRGGGEAGAARPAPATAADPGPPRRLCEAVLAAAASAVLWWSQGADEARTTRALEALVPGDELPAFDDPDGARRWLATARLRVVAAARGEA